MTCGNNGSVYYWDGSSFVDFSAAVANGGGIDFTSFDFTAIGIDAVSRQVLIGMSDADAPLAESQSSGYVLIYQDDMANPTWSVAKAQMNSNAADIDFIANQAGIAGFLLGTKGPGGIIDGTFDDNCLIEFVLD